MSGKSVVHLIAAEIMQEAKASGLETVFEQEDETLIIKCPNFYYVLITGEKPFIALMSYEAFSEYKERLKPLPIKGRMTKRTAGGPAVA